MSGPLPSPGSCPKSLKGPLNSATELPKLHEWQKTRVRCYTKATALPWNIQTKMVAGWMWSFWVNFWRRRNKLTGIHVSFCMKLVEPSVGSAIRLPLTLLGVKGHGVEGPGSVTLAPAMTPPSLQLLAGSSDLCAELWRPFGLNRCWKAGKAKIFSSFWVTNCLLLETSVWTGVWAKHNRSAAKDASGLW